MCARRKAVGDHDLRLPILLFTSVAACFGCSARVYSLGSGPSDAGPTTSETCPHLDFQTVSRVVSLGTDGTLGNAASFQPSVSADGRIVVFTSLADNLVPDDTNGVADVFAYDRDTAKITRISVGASGGQFSAASSMPSISPNGSRVAISSAATNLGGSGSSAAIALTNPALDVNQFIPGLTTVSPLDAATDSINPLLSNGASVLVYQSQAANVVAGDTNNRDDFFVWRPSTGTTERLITANDDPGFVIDDCTPKLSPDGSVLAYCGHLGSASKNVSVLGVDANHEEWLGVTPAGALSNGACYSPALSASADVVAFVCDGADIVPDDTNGQPDVFVRDLTTSETKRVSFNIDGTQWAYPSLSVGISGDGRWVVYQVGLASNATSDPTYEGLSFYDRHCGDSRDVSIGLDDPFTDLSIGRVARIDDIRLSDDGSTLVGTVTNVRTPNAISQIVIVKLEWP